MWYTTSTQSTKLLLTLCPTAGISGVYQYTAECSPESRGRMTLFLKPDVSLLLLQ